MLSSTIHPVRGTTGTCFGGVMGDVGVAAGAAGEDPFGRIVRLYQSNAYLLRELKSVRGQLDRARSYLSTPGCNRTLGEAHVLRLLARRSAALALLRANRRQAQAVLARVGHGPGGD